MTLSTHKKSKHYQGVCQPRGLRREDAALYIGLKPSTFDKLVKDGTLPQPLRFNGCVVWDRLALDRVFDELGEGELDANPWDTAQAPETGEGRPDIYKDDGPVDPSKRILWEPRVPRRIPSSAREAFKPLGDFLDYGTYNP